MADAPGFLARGFVDAEDRLVSADEPLAGLQLRIGGEVPGVVAMPALLQLVRKARMAGLRYARMIEMRDADEMISAWVEASPEAGSGGCALGVASWHTTALAVEQQDEAVARHQAVRRATAELVARLDVQQAILTAQGMGELSGLGQQMAAATGSPWTDFVELPGAAHQLPLHWRLIDGMKIAIAESERDWVATLIPLGAPEAGSDGFELLLTSPQPPRTEEAQAASQDPAFARMQTAVGQEIAPVLRQPIARIIANAETIRTRMAGPLADEYSDYAADIATAGQHLLALIDDLSDLEVVEGEQFSTAPDQIDLADVARRAVGILGVRARERGIAIGLPPEDISAPAIAEFRRVLQVLLNLIGNAIRYSPEGGSISLSTGREGDRAWVTVADEGPGLDPQQQAKIFEKFERLGRSGDGGSGLGLYISRRLARAMGGDIAVESAPGDGARFTLFVPADTGEL